MKLTLYLRPRFFLPAARYTCGMPRACLLLLLAGLLAAQSDELAEKSRRGKEAMAAGRFAEAAGIYADLVRALPDNPGLLMNLGMAHHMAGQDRKAIPPLEAAAKREPSLLPAWLFLGVSYLRLGEPAKATAPLRNVLDLDPRNKEARHMLAGALFSLERFEQAAEHYRKASELDPENPKAWYGLGKTYESLSRRAFADLEKIGPDSAYWLALVAGARMAQQQYSSAFYFYREALQKQPGLRGPHAAVAEIYRKTGHPDWAAVEESKERALGPLRCPSASLECDFSRRRYQEVVIAAQKGKTTEACYFLSLAYNELALDAFSRLTKLPPSAELHQLMAESHRNQRRHAEAIKEWQDALKLSPESPDIERELAVSLHRGRDYEAAQSLLQKLLQADPDSAELNYLLGDSLLNMQQAEKGIPFLKKAAQQAAKELGIHASLGRAYMQIGQAEQAIPHLKAALPLDDDGSLHYQLARAYQSTGQQEPAKEALQKYQEILKASQAERQKLKEEVQITPP